MRNNCRICKGKIITILDFKKVALSGNFLSKNQLNKEKKYSTSDKFREIIIQVNLKHKLFMLNESFRTETQLFGIIINTINCEERVN